MLISETFLPEFIIADLQGEDKETVFEELVDHFCDVTFLVDKREDILSALREREAKMSTGVHPGIAIPHGKTAAVDQSYGVMGISHTGIDYDSLDGKPVYIVFMELAPLADTEHHLHLLKRIAGLLRDADFASDIRNAGSSREAYEILQKYERSEE
jgi:PTS system fructose-specific IIC component/PTS system nitrogen regulatory IIA component